MQQTPRGNFRTQESLSHQFLHSCLGKLVILAGICGVLLVVARFTIPDEETMMTEMTDNIRQCIEANDSIKQDWIDDAINNVGYIFTHADSIPNEEILGNFYKYNKVEYHRHAFYATTLLHNNFKPDGVRVGIGVFGVVIPTVNFNDFLFRLGPMHRGYDQKVIFQSTTTSGENWSNNPELGL